MALPPVPTIKLPPPKQKTGQQPPAFVAFVNKWAAQYPRLKAWAPNILANAREYGFDPVYFASVLLTESGANENTPDSRAGAIGIGQVMPSHIGQQVPWNPQQRVTLENLRDPVFNVRYSAYLLGQAVGAFGYQNAYAQGYNPGWTPAAGGADPLSRLPKNYLPGVSSPGVTPPPPSPTGKAQTGVETQAAKQQLTDPWVVIRNGQVKYVQSAAPPRDAVTSGGVPVTRSQFASFWQQNLNTVYMAYTGKAATAAQAAQILKSGTNLDYQLKLQLSKRPGFVNSPQYKAYAPEYEAAWRSIYGGASKPDQAAIRQAIAVGMGTTAFQEILRERPDYQKSEEFKANVASYQTIYEKIMGAPPGSDPDAKMLVNTAAKQQISQDQFALQLRQSKMYLQGTEFKTNVAQLKSSYESIYGLADQNGQNIVQQAAAGGWSAPQFEDYLRSQPQYVSSPEYQSKMLLFLSKLGLITGSVPSLRVGNAPANQALPYVGGLPNDRRLPTPAAGPETTSPTKSLLPSL